VGHLFERATELHALREAARRAARGKRLATEAAAFLADLDSEVLALQRELLSGNYRPGAYRTFRVQDPKPRLISAAPFRDRVVHHALCAVLEPVLERYAIFDSYACRKGKGTLAALHRAQALARRWPWFLKLDVRRFFETVDHDLLRQRLRRLVKDERLLQLVDRFLDAGTPGCPPGRGLPIGNLTSQHFANLYLGALDHHIKESLRVPGYCRYMDDFLLLHGERIPLRRLRHEVQRFLREELRLELRAEATVLDRVHAGIPFLGFRIWPRLIRFDSRSVRRFRRGFRKLHAQAAAGALDAQSIVRSADSRIGWARMADTTELRRSFFSRLRGSGSLDL